MPSPTSAVSGWTLLIPVKETTIAKSRLEEVPVRARQRLALAFALDTVAAAVACPHIARVVVVSNDPRVGLFRELGADVLSDVPASGLNAALEYGADQVRADLALDIAALQSDLPALRASDLSAVLTNRTEGRWFVPDTAGTGTTMLGARADQAWEPRFGQYSRQAHRALGMAEITTPELPRLRQDVDTAQDLRVAAALGVGAYTRRVLAEVDRSQLP